MLAWGDRGDCVSKIDEEGDPGDAGDNNSWLPPPTWLDRSDTVRRGGGRAKFRRIVANTGKQRV